MVTSDPVVVTTATLREWPLPAPGEGKDARGRLLVVGGSTSTPGAVRLAGEAALRVGAGKLRVATVGSVTSILGVAVPEAATISLAATDEGQVDPRSAPELVDEGREVDAVLVGPGLLGTDAIVDLLADLVPHLNTPVVMDALASSYLTEHPQGAHGLNGHAVLCVNPVELARTADCTDEDVEADPWGVSAQVAERCQVVVLCGGSEKYIVSPEGRRWLVQGGGPGLGVSGSGDVQAGAVAGFLARGAEPTQAAVYGAYLHAEAGGLLSARVGQVGFLARELLDELPFVLERLA
jgi:hydroxyethylthiazole kinase-like uncharacterized protein yjeF